MAFSESICKTVDETIDGCEIEIDGSYTEAHRRRMSRILGFDIENPTRKVIKLRTLMRLLAAAIIAAVIFTACCVFRREIASFVEYIEETFVWVENDTESENQPSKIEEVYTLSYVPKGFEIIDKNIAEAGTISKWQNSSGDSIKFSQMLYNGQFYADIEYNFCKVIYHMNIQIYCRKIENAYSYVWQNEKYSFKLVSDVELSENELTKIVDGLKTE